MQVCEFETKHNFGHWVADWSRAGDCDYSDQNAVLRAHRPILQLSLHKVFQLPLREMTYKDLAAAIDPQFLRQGIRARALRGLRYEKFDDDTMKFWVTSSEHQWNGIEYLNLVKFLSWHDIGQDPDMTTREKALMLLWTSDIQLYCNDPSFLFWGYQYILTQLNASIYPESRRPDVRNPGLRGVVCKHLNRILRSLPFFNGDIAKEIKMQNQTANDVDDPAINEIIQRRDELQRQANEGMNLPPEAQQPPPEIELSPQDQQDVPPESDDPTADGAVARQPRIPGV